MKLDPELERRLHLETRAIHAGQEPDPSTGAIMTPVYLTSTYVQAAPGQHLGYEYSRTHNPTRAALESNLASLESGSWGLSFASGMAATDAICHTLSAGDRIVAGNDLYGGTYRLFTKVFARHGQQFTFVDTTDLAQVERALDGGARLMWVESPSNPMLRITDIEAVAGLARAAGAITVVDNTFATPCLQRPLELGADLVLHSVTKYLGGHSDVVGGAIVGRDPELLERLHFVQNSAGGVQGPFDSFLVLRGIKTLAVRMAAHCAGAKRVAEMLLARPEVERVHYPGLPDHAGHEIAARQMSDFGGMISFEHTGGVEAGCQVAASTRLFACAESLGGVESLIEHPASMTHASIPPEERRKAGLPDGLIRLSVGIEHPDDLIADLEQAFDRVG